MKPAAGRESAPLGKGDLLLFLTTIMWGAGFPLGKIVLGVMPPLAYASTRFLIASLVLLAIVRLREGALRLARAELLPLLGLGLLGFTLFQGVWSVALTMTTAAKGAILISTSPIFGALLAPFFGQRPGPLAWAGILLSFAGIFLVMNNSVTAINLVGGTWAGDLTFLLAAFLWAAYVTLSPPALMRHGPLKATAWAMFLGSAALLVLGIFDLGDISWARADPGTWAAFGFTSMIAGAIGFLWWFDGVGRLGVARSIPYMYLVPVFGVLGSLLLLGESFSAIQTAGAGVILAGITLARRG